MGTPRGPIASILTSRVVLEDQERAEGEVKANQTRNRLSRLRTTRTTRTTMLGVQRSQAGIAHPLDCLAESLLAVGRDPPPLHSSEAPAAD